MLLPASRCFFMGQPSAAPCRSLTDELERLGLTGRLGSDLFAQVNWHQSLSDRFEDEPHLVEQLRRAGERLTARAVTFRMDRIECQPGPDGVHWAFRAERAPADFAQLLQSLGTAIEATTGRPPTRPTAHITISYWAREHLRRMVQIQPVDWVLDKVLLVRGGGRPYHYEVIDHWRLQPPREEPVGEQVPLF
jgi:hypothetical protein